ncbi:MAG: hypothetical protein ABIE07_02415 [Candidatus Zixiibacteriota bacterium]
MTKDEKEENCKILVHLGKWISLYEIIGILLALMTSTFAVYQSYQAVSLTAKSIETQSKSVELQSQEFKIRNRPYVYIQEANLAGSWQSGQKYLYPHSLKVRLHNATDIPATKVMFVGKIFVNNILMDSTFTPIETNISSTPVNFYVGIIEEIYENIMRPDDTCIFEIKCTYSGVLGEGDKEYHSSAKILYLSHTQKLSFSDIKYK